MRVAPAWAVLGVFAALSAAPVIAAQPQDCPVDQAVLDATANAVGSVGDVIVSPPGAIGRLGGDHPALNRPLAPLPGTLSFFDLDGDAAPSKGDVAAWDRGAAGRSVGDILLGDLATTSGTLPFGTVVGPEHRFPPAVLLPYPGGALAFWDESGDGAFQPEEPLYGAQGAALAPDDVRLDAEGYARGSLVRASDNDAGRPLTPGPAIAFLDQDGTGGFNLPDCQTESSSPSSAPATPTPDVTPSPDPMTTPPDEFCQPSPCETEEPAKDTPMPLAAALAGLAVALAVRRRR